MMKKNYEARWSGSYPCLCHGDWTLFIDGEVCETKIPFQNQPANTYGTYEEWHFDDEWCETFESYVDGLYYEEWCEAYQDYLSKIAPKEDWKEIFEAFQAQDWRHSSCGGCI